MDQQHPKDPIVSTLLLSVANLILARMPELARDQGGRHQSADSTGSL